MSRVCILSQPEPFILHTFAPAAPSASRGVSSLFSLAIQILLQRTGSTGTSVGENYPPSPWEPHALSPAGCVIPRPQFLPLSNGDLITNITGLLWRVTEITHQPPPFLSLTRTAWRVALRFLGWGRKRCTLCLSTPPPTPRSEGREGARRCLRRQPPPGGWFSLAAAPSLPP